MNPLVDLMDELEALEQRARGRDFTDEEVARADDLLELIEDAQEAGIS